MVPLSFGRDGGRDYNVKSSCSSVLPRLRSPVYKGVSVGDLKPGSTRGGGGWKGKDKTTLRQLVTLDRPSPSFSLSKEVRHSSVTLSGEEKGTWNIR